VKKRIILSLIAMMGSVFLLVVASFTWFTVSNRDTVGDNVLGVVDLDVSVTLEVSTDGINYSETSSIIISNMVPGTTVYYRLVLGNDGNVPVDIRIFLYGFTDGPADSNYTYDDTKTLRDVLVFDCWNTINSETISAQTISSLLPIVPSGDYSDQSFDLVSSLELPVAGNGIVYFEFQFPGSVGNDYQNLALEIARLSVQPAVAS